MDKKNFVANGEYISADEAKFLEMAKDPVNRQALLERLEKLGLLSAFLAAESGTTQ